MAFTITFEALSRSLASFAPLANSFSTLFALDVLYQSHELLVPSNELLTVEILKLLLRDGVDIKIPLGIVLRLSPLLWVTNSKSQSCDALPCWLAQVLSEPICNFGAHGFICVKFVRTDQSQVSSESLRAHFFKT